jgi:hypothetical protein
VAIERLVVGPAWTGFGIRESAGRYPLRVEGAVSSVVGRLLPGVITTTRHARMYSLHTLAWAEARERGLDRAAAGELVRRCEVVIAAIHHFHEPHDVALSSAHGEGNLGAFLSADRFDVEGAAQPSGLSAGGFADVYQGPCVRIGALTDEPFPRPGVRADIAAVRGGLGALLDLADRAWLTTDELRGAGSLCLCGAAEARTGPAAS